MLDAERGQYSEPRHTWERNSVIRAIDLLEQAIQRDPRYGPALALEAMCYQNLHINGWSKDPEADRRLSIDLARRAIWVASDDPIVLSTAAPRTRLLRGEYQSSHDG